MSEVVTKADLALYMKIDIPANSREDAIRQMINDYLDRYCNRVFAAASYAEKISILSHNQWTLSVKNPPINTLTSVQIGRTSPTDVDTDSYVIDDANAGLIRFTAAPAIIGVHEYTVNYAGGYSAAVMPKDLKLAAMSAMAREIKRTQGGKWGIRARSFAQGSIEMQQLDFEMAEKRTFQLYRLVDLG